MDVGLCHTGLVRRLALVHTGLARRRQAKKSRGALQRTGRAVSGTLLHTGHVGLCHTGLVRRLALVHTVLGPNPLPKRHTWADTLAAMGCILAIKAAQWPSRLHTGRQRVAHSRARGTGHGTLQTKSWRLSRTSKQHENSPMAGIICASEIKVLPRRVGSQAY